MQFLCDIITRNFRFGVEVGGFGLNEGFLCLLSNSVAKHYLRNVYIYITAVTIYLTASLTINLNFNLGVLTPIYNLSS